MSKSAGNPTDFESFLTWEALTEVLSYDPAKGEFRWVKSGRLGWVNRLAGYIDQREGYRRIEILGRAFYTSRLAWLFMKREWPRGYIDHRNGNRADDRWDNLRQVSRVQNGQNRTISRNNTSGVGGVTWMSASKCWQARITVEGKRIFLGLFDTLEEATVARKGAERQYFGEYQRAIDAGAPVISPQEAAAKAETPKRITRRGIASDFESFLTQDELVSILSYNPATGEFIWRDNKTNPRRIKIGQRAGKWREGEYADIQIMGRKFRAHRLAFLYMAGRWPNGDVDHTNGVKSDNSWANLREATRSQNAHNRGANRNSTTGEKGVFFRKDTKRWRAGVGVNGQMHWLGTFDTKEEAIAARSSYENKNLGDFASFKQIRPDRQLKASASQVKGK